MVPEQVWDWHFCSFWCVFFVFLFVFCLPLFSSCLVLSVASWGRVNLAVSSSSWEWRFLYSYERYFYWNEPKHCLSDQDLLWYLFLWNLQSESLEGSVLQFWVQLWSRLGTSQYPLSSQKIMLSYELQMPTAGSWELIQSVKGDVMVAGHYHTCCSIKGHWKCRL